MVGRAETAADDGRVPPEPVDQGAAALADARERTLLTAYELFRSHGVTAVGVDRIVADARGAATRRRAGAREPARRAPVLTRAGSAIRGSFGSIAVD